MQRRRKQARRAAGSVRGALLVARAAALTRGNGARARAMRASPLYGARIPNNILYGGVRMPRGGAAQQQHRGGTDLQDLQASTTGAARRKHYIYSGHTRHGAKRSV